MKGLQGDTTHFQALSTALSGTVGTGNIAGVAYALHLGGPPALFWMLVTAFLGMTTKMVEVSISHKYREVAPDKTMAGGPMYYMKNATFRLMGRKVNMMPFAIIISVATVCCAFGTGNMPQINSMANSVYETYGIATWITGISMAILLALVIIGGIKRIAAVTSRLVPIMAILYFIGCFTVLLYNYENIIPSIVSVFSHVFSGQAAIGGFMGASVAYAFQSGVGRGLFSNEAGQGSAPIAHASAKANEPFSEGMVSLLEPFIDTIIICFLTGLTLLSSGVWQEKHRNDFQTTDMFVLSKRYVEQNPEDQKMLRILVQDATRGERDSPSFFHGRLGVEEGFIQNNISIIHSRSLAENIRVLQSNDSLYTGFLEVSQGRIIGPSGLSFKGQSLLHSAPLTTMAFTRGFLGDWGKHIVSIGLLLFAFSSAISWSYYGDRAMIFIFGRSSVIYYRFLYIIAFLIASFVDTTIIWNFSNVTIAFMTTLNLVGILWLRKEIPKIIKGYGIFFRKQFPKEKHPRF